MITGGDISSTHAYSEALRHMTLRYERLVQALSILRQMNELDDPRKSIDHITRGILETIALGLAAENCSLMLLDETGEFLELRGACSPFDTHGRTFEPGMWHGPRFRLGEGVVGKAALSNSPIRISDSSQHEGFILHANSKVCVRSMLCFPLCVDKKVIGVLNLTHSEPDFFSLDTEHVMALIAERAARLFATHLLHERVRDSEDHYRLVTENAVDAILVFDPRGRILSANPAVEQITGCPTGHFIAEGSSWEAGIVPEDLPHFLEDRIHLLESRKTSAIEYRYQDASGQLHMLEQRSSALLDMSGEVTGVIAITRDITERKQAEEELARYRDRLEDMVQERTAQLTALNHKMEREILERIAVQEECNKLVTAIEQTGEAILITNAAGVIEYVNPAFESLSGYTAEEVLGKTPEILHASMHDDALNASIMSVVSSGEIWTGSRTNRRKDGTLFEQKGSISPVRDASGHIINYVSVQRDVTLETTLEQRLRQSEKMEAVGQLASGVAHDFNNLLQGIQGYAALAQEKTDPNDTRHSYLANILKASDRATALTRQLLMFSRQQATEPHDLDVNDIIIEFAKMLSRLIGEHVELRLDLAEDIPLVHADAGQLTQVLINLCVNARDAMPRGGIIIVSTSKFVADAQFCESYPNASAGEYLLCTISDNGAGMAPEIKERVFEPFFTTKEMGKGTGLGLSTVYGIVKQHNGVIDFESFLGEGATFRIYLPAVTQLCLEMDCLVCDAPAVGGSETILVAEDDDIVQRVIVQVLQNAGYRVLLATDGEEALNAFEKHSAEIDLALLDVTMPKRHGTVVCEHIQAKMPHLPVLFSSAHSTSALADSLLKKTNIQTIQKPFGPETLLRRIRLMLDHKSK